jgi:uncharacterized protein
VTLAFRLSTRSLAATLLVASFTWALDPSQLKPQGYVSDFSHVLDSGSRSELERYCGQVERATGAQIAVVTVPSIGAEPIEDFANDLFRQWGVGKKGKDEGVLLLLVVRDRKDRVEVGYGLEPILPDGFVGSVLREMTPSLRDHAYGQALLAGTAEIGDQIAKAKGVTIARSLPRRGPPANHPQDDGGVPWPLILIAVIFIFGLIGRGGGGGFLTWMMLGNLLGGSRYRGGGSWGGGGFGNYDGGSGFGGFGGGDSGGGGASGSW